MRKKKYEAGTAVLSSYWVVVPDLPNNHILFWYHINEIKAEYDNITINISGEKNIRFWLKKNLHFEELEQIHEFCRHYLKN